MGLLLRSDRKLETMKADLRACTIFDGDQSRQIDGAGGRRSAGGAGRLPTGVFAIVAFVKLRFNPLLSPQLVARPPWVLLKVVVPLCKVSVYCCLGRLD